MGRLTALKVEKAKEPGMYADGGGLYLRVTRKARAIGYCATCWIAGRGGWGSAPSRSMAFRKPVRRRWTRAASGMRG